MIPLVKDEQVTRELRFTWSERESLANALRGSFKRVSSDFAYYGASSITLWKSEDDGITIHSVMHDLSERIEVGVLAFEKRKDRPAGGTIIDLPSGFEDEITAFRLVITESDTRADSGLVIRSLDGHEIVIVAAAFPFALFVSGISIPAQEVSAEYPLDDYERIRL